jgi:hypothetical protein
MPDKHDTHPLSRCASLAFRPLAAGQARKKTSSVAARFVALAERIFILCIHCDTVMIPEFWAKQTLLVDGRKSDKCTRDIFPPVTVHQPKGNKIRELNNHYGAVTLSHKLVVAYARLHRYRHIVILEEDFQIYGNEHVKGPPSVINHRWSSDDFPALRDYLEGADWDLLRLSYLAVTNQTGQTSILVDAKTHDGTCVPVPGLDMCACRKECRCVMTHRNSSLCSTSGCLALHDSAAYFLSYRAYSKFLSAGGVIDVGVFAALRSTLMLPSMVWQKQKLAHGQNEELLAEALFARYCVT